MAASPWHSAPYRGFVSSGINVGPLIRSAVPDFETIYDQYFRFVWSSVRRLGVGMDAIDDVVQDVFIVIHSKLHTVRDPSALRSWIYGIVRRTVSQPKYIRNCKKAIKTAFQTQIEGLGFSLVEILSTCSTNWGMSPIEALKWLEENMIPYYPLGDYKVIDEVKALA